MAGPLRTLTRIFEPTTLIEGNRELHATFISYFDSHPGFQRIASNFGTSGTGLSGSFVFTGSSGENAWAIYRTLSSSIPYDIAFVWAYNNPYVTNTWIDGTNWGFGFAMAWHSSSQAWSGSVNNNGSDAFFTASRPWKTGSIVFPRANGPGGTYQTNQNCVMKPFAASITNNNVWQLTIVGDNDNTHAFLQNADESLLGDAKYFFAFGQYLPITSSMNLPLFCFAFNILNEANDIGSTTSGEVGNQNGGLSYTTSSNVRTFRMNYPENSPRKAPRPAPAFFGNGNSRAYRFPINLMAWEDAHYQTVGVFSGCFVAGANAFGNIQDVSRSYVSFKPNTTSKVCFLLSYSGSTDFFLRGAFE